MLHSYESRILLQNNSASNSHIAFFAHKSTKGKTTTQNYTSKKRGFTPAVSSSNQPEITEKLNFSAPSPSKSVPRGVCTEEELQVALKHFLFVCQICHKLGHNAHRCFKQYNKEFRTPALQIGPKNVQQAISALQVNQVDISQWLCDSGASFHMTGNLTLFDTYDVYNGSDIVMVMVRNGLPIEHIGQVTLFTAYGTLVLINVLHVPSLKQNLLSISQFTTDNDCYFLFDSEGFTVTHGGSQRVIFSSTR